MAIDHSELERVVAVIDSVTGSQGPLNIPGEQVRTWVASEDVEVLGAVFVLLTDSRFYPRIVPPMSVQDYIPFLERYYRKCITEDPDGDWADSRYTAAWGFVQWFFHLWNDENVPRDILGGMKAWLSDLYKKGDPDVQSCIEAAVLEQLFREKDVAGFFSDWSEDKQLEKVYKNACNPP